MKRLLVSILTVGVVGAAAIAGTNAFFSDTETSTGNVLSAGSLDLKIDSTEHYAGLTCINTATSEDPVYRWDGVSSTRPDLAGQPCTGTWSLDDLTGHAFFSLSDIKPGDVGEPEFALEVQHLAGT